MKSLKVDKPIHIGETGWASFAKYVIWDLVEKGVFKDLKRGENTITKTYDGDEQALLNDVAVPPIKKQLISSH